MKDFLINLFFLKNRKKPKILERKLYYERELFLNAVVEKSGKESFNEQFLTFQKKHAQVLGSEDYYENFINYYLNFYLFDSNQNFSEILEERKKFKFLSSFIHSIFWIKKNRISSLVVQDFFSKKKYEIKSESFLFYGFQKKSCIQGFLFKTEDNFVLLDGFLTHSEKSFSILKKTRKKISNSIMKKKLLSDLIELNLKSLRSSNNLCFYSELLK